MSRAKTPSRQERQPEGSICPQCGTLLADGEDCLGCLLTLGLGLSDSTPLDGLQTARYTILRPLGQGGMGEVFLAQDTALDRKAALKFLSEELQQNPGAEKHLLDEAKAAAALDHPFVCKVYETGDLEGSAFIAMEYVEGQTLRQVLDNQRLPLERSLRIADEIADALQSAHRHGIVHRDLKPSNVMLTPDGHVKVMDFGIARRLEAAPDGGGAVVPDWTRETSVQGSVLYMSPQQARGERVDARSDIFSFGVLLYEMIAGVNPFRRDTHDETWQALLAAEHPPLTSATGRLPKGLRETVEQMLASDPRERFQSADQVRGSLHRVGGQMAARQSGWRKWVRSPLRLSALLLVMVALVVLGLYLGGWNAPPPQAGIGRSENPRAQAAFVEGHRRLVLRTPASLSEAAQRFRQSVREDPGFAAAWAGLAESQILLASYGIRASEEVFPEALQAAQQALELDSRQAEAQTALAFIRFSFDWDWEAAEKEFQQAINLAPNDSDTLRWYGFYLAAQGRMDESLQLMQQAQNQDPLSWLAIVSLARCHYLRREYDLAAGDYHKALDLQPGFRPAHLGLGLVYLKQGQLESAAQSFRKGLAGSKAHELLAEAFQQAASGNPPRDIQADLQTLRAESGQNYLSPYFVAVYYQALGETDRVFEWLEKAYQERSEHLVALRVDPIFDNLRIDSRFQGLAGRIF
ncbi:MAG: protein kinase [Acidobacteriota bacterium]